jgi:hypothetical protein
MRELRGLLRRRKCVEANACAARKYQTLSSSSSGQPKSKTPIEDETGVFARWDARKQNGFFGLCRSRAWRWFVRCFRGSFSVHYWCCIMGEVKPFSGACRLKAMLQLFMTAISRVSPTSAASSSRQATASIKQNRRTRRLIARQKQQGDALAIQDERSMKQALVVNFHVSRCSS